MPPMHLFRPHNYSPGEVGAALENIAALLYSRTVCKNGQFIQQRLLDPFL